MHDYTHTHIFFSFSIMALPLYTPTGSHLLWPQRILVTSAAVGDPQHPQGLWRPHWQGLLGVLCRAGPWEQSHFCSTAGRPAFFLVPSTFGCVCSASLWVQGHWRLSSWSALNGRVLCSLTPSAVPREGPCSHWAPLAGQRDGTKQAKGNWPSYSLGQSFSLFLFGYSCLMVVLCVGAEAEASDNATFQLSWGVIYLNEHFKVWQNETLDRHSVFTYF